jgi:16S rRNA (uracil1498-N3)-methyltransferase
MGQGTAVIRLHLQDDLAAGARISLGPDQSRYLLTVMRQGLGDELLVFNGRDGEWRACIVEAGKRGAVLEPVSRVRPQASGPDLDLLIALVKRARLETIVEKAAELGVQRIRPVITRRTNADHARIDRLQAIAAEAAEQTGRLDVPEVSEPAKLDRLLDDWGAGRALVFCDEAGDAPPLLQAVSSRGAGSAAAAILIGPEGGFDPSERERLRALPFTVPVSLGPRILRADTAAISALTLWQAAVGDWRATCPATDAVPNEPGVGGATKE